MNTHTPKLATVGEIATRLDIPVHRIEYVIRANHIPVASRAGNLRVFSDESVEQIARILGATGSTPTKE